MPRAIRVLLILVFLALIAIALINLVGPNHFGSRTLDLPLSRLYKEVELGNVEHVRFQDRHLRGMLRDGRRFEVRAFDKGHSGMETLVGELRARGVEFWVDPPPVSTSIIALLSVIAFPLMILALIYFLVLRPAQGSSAARIPSGFLATLIGVDPPAAGTWEAQHELLLLRKEVADLRVAVQHLEDEVYSRPNG